MNTCRYLIVPAVLSLLFAGSARAGNITLYDVDKGYYSDIGEYDPDSWEGYVAGKLAETEYRNFFVFDLSEVADEIISAKLVINTQGVGGGGGTYTLHNVETDVSILREGGPDLVDVFADLGEGDPAYGSLVISSPYADVEIPLGAAFLSDANDADGLFAIGGALGPLGDDDQYVFSPYGNPAVQLVLKTVPEPGSAALLLMGAAAACVFGFSRRRA